VAQFVADFASACSDALLQAATIGPWFASSLAFAFGAFPKASKLCFLCQFLPRFKIHIETRCHLRIVLQDLEYLLFKLLDHQCILVAFRLEGFQRSIINAG